MSSFKIIKCLKRTTFVFRIKSGDGQCVSKVWRRKNIFLGSNWFLSVPLGRGRENSPRTDFLFGRIFFLNPDWLGLLFNSHNFHRKALITLGWLNRFLKPWLSGYSSVISTAQSLQPWLAKKKISNPDWLDIHTHVVLPGKRS